MNCREIKIWKKYRHFKGNEYLVLYVAKHSETLEDMVVYQGIYGEKRILTFATGYLIKILDIKTRGLVDVEGGKVYL